MLLWLAQVSGTFPGPGAGSSPGSEWDIFALIFTAGPVVKGVMLILLAFSVTSWAIIIAKYRQLSRAQRETREFLESFWAAPGLAAALKATRPPWSPAAVIFRQGYEAAFPENPGLEAKGPPGEGSGFPRGDAARRAVGRALQEERRRLSQSLSFLATCGNTAPFIGLFGTVWGIMTSFHAMGLKGAASVATVAPGIAEALIATAAGLAAAIPAVVAYNYFLGRVRSLEAELTAFANDLLPLLASPRGREGQEGH